MSEPIVFISHFKVKEGKLDELKQLNQKVTEHIKADKPGTFTFLQYTNKERTELGIIHIFPDAEAFDQHNEGVGERAGKAFEFIVHVREPFEVCERILRCAADGVAEIFFEVLKILLRIEDAGF